MPGFAVTRGLGGSAASLISQGFISDVRRIFAGATRFTKRAIGEFSENLKISAMLISANGKELVKPIINNVSKAFRKDEQYTLTVKPKKLIARRAEPVKVRASFKKLEKL